MKGWGADTKAAVVAECGRLQWAWGAGAPDPTLPRMAGSPYLGQGHCMWYWIYFLLNFVNKYSQGLAVQMIATAELNWHTHHSSRAKENHSESFGLFFFDS